MSRVAVLLMGLLVLFFAPVIAGPTVHTYLDVSLTNNSQCTIKVEIHHEKDGGKQLIQTREVLPDTSRNMSISSAACFDKKRYYTY